MTATNYLYLIVMALVVLGWGTWVHAESDVTIVSPPATTRTPPKPLASDGTPVIHKSAHKKKRKSSETATASTPKAASVATHKPAAKEPSYTAVIREQPREPSASSKIPSGPSAPIRLNQTASVPLHPANSSSTVPTVETGLPIARHAGSDGADGRPIPSDPAWSVDNSRQRLFASAFLAPVTSSSVGLYSSSDRSANPAGDFPFANFSRRVKNIYPWKTHIITTMFYIGEGPSSLSSTDNKASSWVQEWVSANHGTDNPYDRNGYAAGNHASTVNPFYVALPFNDLAFPEKAREWLPPGWHRPNKDGKPVSACKDRWVEIKTEDGSGHTCYAQWEDVGPLRYDHAEYVFGDERPDTYTRAGLDVSPAVAQYLNLNEDKRAMTRWRFVDDEDVQPGPWLTLDEQAVLYRALHQLKNANPTALPSIQREAEPIDDSSNLNSNRKRIGAAKG